MKKQKALEISGLTEQAFNRLYGDVIRIVETTDSNGKTYSAIVCTGGVRINFPRPESLDDFDRNYRPAIHRIMDHITKEGN